MATKSDAQFLPVVASGEGNNLIRRRPGVLSTRVGYSGGDVPNATYRKSRHPR